ncbi:MAG: hypothetical protein GXO61_00190 [Epsilonproteobacteria bacterium]|nr:hypothetical protein [Campylobacterota bacterium]
MGKVVAFLVVAITHLFSAKGVLIPFYHYPTKEDEEIKRLLELKKRYPLTQIITIINPSNGTFRRIDPNFVKMISTLHKAGITTIGYVHTSYGNRKKEKVILDILRWERYYKKFGIDGIFVDEVNSSIQSLPYYQDLHKVVYDRFNLLALNPGVEVDKSFYSLADIVVSYEADKIPNFCPNKEKSALLLHTQKRLHHSLLDRFVECYDYLYITEQSLANPWERLSSYLDILLAKLQKR